MPQKVNEQTRKYLADIGRAGGRKSKRTLSAGEASKMAMLRWSKPKGEKEVHVGTALPSKQRKVSREKQKMGNSTSRKNEADVPEL